MLESTTRILTERYDPTNPLLQWVIHPGEVEPDPVEVQKAAITLEQLIIKVRHELLTSWGLDASGRHEFADDIVALTAIQQLSGYNVTDLPPAYKEKA
ncbi:hypothetical protein J2W17_000477 [Pseudomonas lini]|uniref:hypothetical protein n=1 Tax=Pseudomonas lini TaxID=163011 RepID=UPI00278B8BFF|nr:hypothetical protein [Pseudomonas lini]MDQ0121540.1 hypothetical protein [Pseudomonas lini]